MINENVLIALGVLAVIVIIIIVVILSKKRDNYQYPGTQLYSQPGFPWSKSTGNGGQTIIQPYSSSLAVDNNGNLNTTAIVPLGAIIMWAGKSMPYGWGLCDGTTYGDIISPNLTSKFIVGAGGSSASQTEYAVGDMGGEEYHQLTSQEMPAHQHAVSSAVLNLSNGGLFNTVPRDVSNTLAGSAIVGWDGSSAQTTLPGTSWTGGDPKNKQDYTYAPSATVQINQTLPHNNMPPYYALAYIIKFV